MMMETAANRKIEETLAKLSASVTVARAKEPPDQQPVATPTRGWLFLPSVTKASLVPEALPRLRLKAPRFDGENALDWINKIQAYYNHDYTPLDDRLYLTQYLFDPPASDWMEYWVENNKGKGWDDFLLALKQRFDPDLYDYVGRLATLRQTSTVEAYRASFESLLQKVSHIGDSTLSSLFIAGLKSPLKQVVLMRRPSTLQETFAIAQKLDQRQPNCITAFPVVNREPIRPPPQRNEEVKQEVFALPFFDVAVSCVVDDNQLDVLPSNELMDSSIGNKLEVKLVENDALVGIDSTVNSNRVLDLKHGQGDCEESRKKIHTLSIPLNLEVEGPVRLSDSELLADILLTENDDTGLPCRTAHSSSSFESSADEEQVVRASHLSSSSLEIVDHSPPVHSVIPKRVEASESSNSLNHRSTYSDSDTGFHMKLVKWCDDEDDDGFLYVESAQSVKDFPYSATPTLSYSDDTKSYETQLAESIDTSILQPHLLTLEVESYLLDLMNSKMMEMPFSGNAEWGQRFHDANRDMFSAIFNIFAFLVRAPECYSGNKYGHLDRILLDGEGSRDTLQFGRDKGVHIFDPGALEVRVGSMGSFAVFMVLDHDKWNVAYGEASIRLGDSRIGESSSRPQSRPQFQQVQLCKQSVLVIENRHENRSTYMTLFEVLEMDEDGYSLVFHMANFHFVTSFLWGRWPSVMANADREVAEATMEDRSNDCVDTKVSCEAVAEISNEHEAIGAGISALNMADVMIRFPNSTHSYQSGGEDPSPSVVDLYAPYNDCGPLHVGGQVLELESFWFKDRMYVQPSSQSDMKENEEDDMFTEIYKILHSYFDSHLEGKVDFNRGGVDRDSNPTGDQATMSSPFTPEEVKIVEYL